jgi:hypothetical protein
MKLDLRTRWLQNLVPLAVLGAAWGIPISLNAQVFGVIANQVANTYHFAGTFGMVFTPDSELMVTELGAFDFGSYSTGSATVELWRSGDSSSLASASVDLSGGTATSESWTFVYANISAVPLHAGVQYALVWHDNIGYAGQPLSVPASLTTTPGSGVTVTHAFNHVGLGLSGNPLDDIASLTASSPGNFQVKATVDMTLSPAAVPESEYAIPAMAGVMTLLQAFRVISRKSKRTA